MPERFGKKEEFITILESINPSKNAYEVFSDWLIMTAASLYSWKKDENVENEYVEISRQYSTEDQDKLARLLAVTANALEERKQDFLGEVFISANLTNAKKAQFFTSYHVSELMAEIVIGGKELPKKNEICTILRSLLRLRRVIDGRRDGNERVRL
jgi:type I restriction-modification system DNA methylase subunit